MTKTARLITLVGCVVAVGCSTPSVEDAGVGGGTGGDGGGMGAGGGTGGGTGGGDSDGGVGGGAAGGGAGGTGGAGGAGGGAAGGSGGAGGGATTDGGCVGTVATHVAFASAPQTVLARACSAPLKVELRNVCGAPVQAAAATEVTFTATGTLEVLGDGACIGKPSMFLIPAGASALDVFFRDPIQEMPTVTVSSTGLDSGTQTQTVNCPAGEKPCVATLSCIPIASCCENADCTAPKVCNATTGQCRVPACASFPHSCSTYERYDGGSIAIASPFSPKCVSTSTSASVKFSNSGSIHPLEQDCGPTDVNISTFGSTATVTGLSSFGSYGFHCKNHPTFEVGAIKTP